MNPTTEEVVAHTSAEGLDLEATVNFARERGGPALRALTLAERAGILDAMAQRIHEHRNELLELAMINGGNTRSDAKFDVDGAAGALAHYAGLGKEMGDTRVLVDGEGEQVGQSPRLSGRHVYLPRKGVA
ncbi:MAG: aldehyde dehydrogenase family protein, partial [Pseudomonadota bacterium]